MNYGMHHYLMDKASQQEGMRKEAAAAGYGIREAADK